MSFYKDVYVKLCESNKNNHINYKKYSNIHKHHILPKHMEGKDENNNYTYLSIREHIIAHFLLWKIYKNVNDLRSMKMLGAKLSSNKRKIIGIWCRDNNIGFHGLSIEKRKEFALKGLETQKITNSTNSFYFWSTPEGRKKRSSMGGKASFLSGNNTDFLFWCSEKGLKQRASMGGKSHKNKKCMYKPGDTTFIRVKPENINEKLEQGYIFGSPIKTNQNRIYLPSKRRKKVSDGNTVFDSVEQASKIHNVTPGAIVYRCKSKKSNWFYV